MPSLNSFVIGGLLASTLDLGIEWQLCLAKSLTMSTVAPQPVSSLLLSSQEILQDVFGYQQFRQGQQAVIDAITAE